ncbi:MAG: hypothetical protein ACRBBW_13145 [Cellvibrionaceae bacterium]
MSEYGEQDLIEIPDPEESIDLTNVLAESGDEVPGTEDAPVSVDGEQAVTGDDSGKPQDEVAEAVAEQSQADSSTKADGGDQDANHEPRQRKRKDPQKRINQLSREAKEANERAAAAEAKLALIEEEKFESEKKAKEQEIISRRQAAAENADLPAMFEATDELHELRTATPEQAEDDSAGNDDGGDGEQGADEPLPMADSAKAWMDRNTWFEDPDNADLAQAAMDVENTLRQRGYELGDDLYEAIDKVIANDPRFEDVRPEMATSDDRAEEQAAEPEKPVAPERPNIPVTTTKASQSTEEISQYGRLSRFDIKTMQNFNLDPNNPRHRKAFLDRKN